jgi:hypothetical protein
MADFGAAGKGAFGVSPNEPICRGSCFGLWELVEWVGWVLDNSEGALVPSVQGRAMAGREFG